MSNSEQYEDVLTSSHKDDATSTDTQYQHQKHEEQEEEKQQQSSSQSFSPSSFINDQLAKEQQQQQQQEAAADDDADELNESSIAEWRRIFALFDPHSLGLIQSSDLGYVLRSLSYNPCESDINDLLNMTDHDGSGLLSFPTFCSLLSSASKTLARAPTQQQILDWFQPFDMYHTGKMKARDFCSLLLSYGEPLTQEDILALITEMQIDGDNDIDIQQFIQHMTDTSTVITDTVTTTDEDVTDV